MHNVILVGQQTKLVQMSCIAQDDLQCSHGILVKHHLEHGILVMHLSRAAYSRLTLLSFHRLTRARPAPCQRIDTPTTIQNDAKKSRIKKINTQSYENTIRPALVVPSSSTSGRLAKPINYNRTTGSQEFACYMWD